jgi:predicted O-methyltransferase YrrM
MTEPLIIDVYGFLDPREAWLLRDLAATVPEGGTIVEIGSFRGKSTVALALGAQQSHATVWAIDDHAKHTQGKTEFGPEDNGAFLQNIVRMQVTDVIRVLNLRSEQVAQIWTQPIDLLWIDGGHEYDDVKRDFEQWSPLVQGKIAMHDTGGLWLGVTRFVNELLAAGQWRKAAMEDATSVFERVERGKLRHS